MAAAEEEESAQMDPAEWLAPVLELELVPVLELELVEVLELELVEAELEEEEV